MPEIRQPVGASGAAQGRVAAPEVLTSGMAVLPIDVEAIEDDDVQMLSSPRDFNQARNQSRRNRPLVLLDENLELSIGPSVNVDDHLSRVPPNSFRRRRRFSPNRIIINCDAYVNVDDDDINAKRTKISTPRAEPEKVMMPKETVFSCPICINSLALRGAAMSLSKLADTAREELPSTMAAVRLSGMEISELTLELNDLREEITDGVHKSAQAMQAAEAGIRRIGSLAHQKTMSMIQERANLPSISLRPLVAGAARRTSDAVGQATKKLRNLLSPAEQDGGENVAGESE
ncbi:hypothetical protein HPP92_021426 [Vanilla planifolia]|uniref:Uncharacterized protein n=1 Tax=Vanilla planifolia TaxID=51239 RepID=A0A835Q136_VANPL|nr:hypothetical protein HPP92_021426 [Vanilla planifolia]